MVMATFINISIVQLTYFIVHLTYFYFFFIYFFVAITIDMLILHINIVNNTKLTFVIPAAKNNKIFLSK